MCSVIMLAILNQMLPTPSASRSCIYFLRKVDVHILFRSAGYKVVHHVLKATCTLSNARRVPRVSA